ncbi:MAG TPA: DUF523 and DUF1722 domain-containing protein [Candidatus Deferrimicrobiaceae bacterium]|nr:DUF523 and DUF1722 domain-containing protein [Candidatus Deferrimicrobiaceae bacterium]
MPAPAPAWRSPDLPIRVGLSSCLLGEEVRYDGGHQKDTYITGVLGGHFTWVAVCPEMEVGMGVPREPIRLVGDAAAPRLLGVTSGTDHTERMNEFARRRVDALRGQGLSGYILKRASPSCGMERVKVYRESGPAARTGVGLFARVLTETLPLLPVEEEGRLNDAHLRDNFITRVFAYRRLAALRESAPRPAAVVEFHTAHKYLVLAHSPSAYARLGRLVAEVPRAPREAWLDRYGEGFMRALTARATTRKHVNVLQHIVGFFKKQLGAAEKRELLGVIGDYARSLVPLVVPITLINHHVARFDVAYVRDQVYLHPHPKELMLRNHV